MNRIAAALCALPLLAAAAEPAAPPPPVIEGVAAPAPPSRLQIYQRVMPRYQGADIPPDGGCVTVRFEIKYDGFVGDVEVLEAKPKTLAAPTVEAMKQWVFQSFPKSEARIHATQTFHFTPETMRLPAEAIRGPFAVVGADGTIASAGCGAAPPKPAVTTGAKKK